MPPACRSCPTGVYRGNCAGCNAGRRSNRWSAGSKCACKHPAVLPFKSLHNTRICIPCRDLFSTVASTPEETPASTPTPPASTPASTPALTGASFVSPTKHARSVFRTPSPTKFPQRDTETRSGKHYISIPAAHPTTPLRSTVGHWQHTITEWCDCGKARGEAAGLGANLGLRIEPAYRNVLQDDETGEERYPHTTTPTLEKNNLVIYFGPLYGPLY